MSEYDPAAIEARWRQRWQDEGTYEPDPEDGEDPTFITVAYPYPSGGMHIGHARTYTVPDVYARYKRLQGEQVLFPMAWHVTGTPIIGAVERLKNEEPEQMSVLRDTYNVPESTLKDLETPMGFARYFIENHYKRNMKALGLSVDWRREFTTNDDRYSQFISWQYETLRDRGCLERGLHPVKYCTNEHQPVTTHDLLEGEEAEFQEYSLIRFELNDGTIVPMATLRPETVRGVTNAFVDPDGEYVRATVDGEPWLVSEEAIGKLELQEREIEIIEHVDGASLVGERVANPVTGEDVLILPATFVDTDNATGVVMSVPAHSPDDYVALQEVKANADRLTEYGIDPAEVAAIEPVPILAVEGYGEVPARDAVESYGINSQDDPALEEATQELYNREFHEGVLDDEYGEFAGSTVEDVREELGAFYREQGAFDAMYEFSEEVVCRCGGAVEVAEQETWFLRYNDADWKEVAHRAVERMEPIPAGTHEQFDHTIDWLNEWPCIRNYGLGTRLPWDRDFVIEPLSDSTVYMAYYTIAHRLDDIPVDDLDREFFDALFYGPDAVEEPDPRALELREEWRHWYPVDWRCSGNDLIRNHLTFYLFHHAKLFDEDNWPGGITTMGMGLLEGEAMSSSKGHVVLPAEAIDEYGADTVRFFLLNAAEPWQDYDWRDDLVGDTRDQLERFHDRAMRIAGQDAPDEQPDLERIDRWLLAKLQATIETATEAMERFETRTASQAAFYGFEEHLRWYRRRADTDRPAARWTLRQVLQARVRLLAPFVPFLANELHEELTGEPAREWPAVDEAFVDPAVEREEQLVVELTDDVRDIVEVIDEDPDRIRIFVAADWKYDVFEQVLKTGADVGAVMGELMSDPAMREHGDAANEVAADLVELARSRDKETLGLLAEIDEERVYATAESFLAREFGAEVSIEHEEGADHERAATARPFRPAVLIE